MKRNSEIDLMKFIFSLCVLGVHGIFAGFTTDFIPSGHLAVDFFFMVSAYYTTRKVMSHKDVPLSLSDHFIKRIKGVYPPYLLAVIFGTVVYVTVSVLFDGRPVSDIYFDNVLFDIIPLQIFGFSILDATYIQWFVTAIIVTDAILFALCIKFRCDFTKVFAPLIAVFLMGYICMTSENLNSPGFRINDIYFTGFVRSIADMFLGALIYEISDKLRTYKLNSLGICSVTLTKMLFLLLMFVCVFTEDHHLDFHFIFLSVVYLALVFAYPVRLKGASFIGQLSKISSTIYLIHVPIGIFINHLLSEYAAGTRIILYYTVSVLVAYLLKITVEFAFKFKAGRKIGKLFTV